MSGAGVRHEVPAVEQRVVLRADLGERVRALHLDGVGRAAGLEQPLALLPADPHLLGEVVLRGRGALLLRHDPQAYFPRDVMRPVAHGAL